MPPPSWIGDMHRVEDRLDRLLVDRLPFEGAVEIDHMQPVEALLLERARLRRGIGVEHRRLRHLALAEPHALPVFQVDGREQDHGFHLRKLAISASPSFWLFSGWNWLPATLSLATNAVIGPRIVGGGDQRIGARRHEMIGVHEIGVEARIAGRDALEQSVLARELERVPAHMRDLERGVARARSPSPRLRSSRAPA